ncbi:hypothetical protein JCM11251_006183 [Rhodosporidiobolus azoricus]
MRSPSSLLIASAALAAASLAHAASPHSPGGAAHHAVRDALLAARDGGNNNASGGQAGAGSLLMERAEELEAQTDECDDDGVAEWFAGDEYEAVVRLQERAEAGYVGGELERRVVKNPKYPLNPKWKNNWSTNTTATASSQRATTTTRGLAASASPTTTKSDSSSTKSSSASATKTTTSSASYSLPTVASSCASMYTNTNGGAIYGPQAGTGAAAKAFMPKPSTFIVRSGNKLYLDGDEFRIVGPNIYWLGLDENVNWQVTYPGKTRIREAMAMTVAMGGNTIRAHTLGASTGHSKSLWPKAWETNAAAWDTIDYSIWAAREYGLRLIIPLSDNYAYYHGGKYDFIRWAGADTNDGSQFYYNSNVIKIFKDFISVLLNHKNTYTGVALKDDPTILAWETGNEYGGYMLGGGPPPASWTRDIARYIKSIAPSHLVADGTDGLTNYDGSLGNTGLGVAEVDLVTDHFYPALQWLLEKDNNWMKSYPDKVFYVGENDWTGQKGGSDLDTFYKYIKDSMPGSGSMMWSMFGRDDKCCQWITHNDGYSLYYPNGSGSTLTTYATKLMKHWYAMRGLTAPSVLPAVACPQLELSS